MQWMTVISQKTALATPARWAWASLTQFLCTWCSKLNIHTLSHCTSWYLWGFLWFLFLFCSVHQMCTRWMATLVKRNRWYVWQCLLVHTVFYIKKTNSSWCVCTIFLLRVAALMGGAKPKTGSASTFGERVSLIFLCDKLIYIHFTHCKC